MRHAVRLHDEMRALVRDRGVRHAVHGSVGRHYEALVLAVLARHVAQHTVALDDARACRWCSTVHEVVEQALGVLSRAQDAHLRGRRGVGELELDRDEGLGLVDDHGLAAGAHHALAFAGHGFAHEGLLVRPGYDGDVTAEPHAAKQALNDAAIVDVRKNIREIEVVIHLVAPAYVIAHAAAYVLHRVRAVARHDNIGPKPLLPCIPGFRVVHPRPLGRAPFLGNHQGRRTSGTGFFFLQHV